ncbi:MAG: CsbD family protein [Thermomonas haemolytica]
MNKDIIAGNWKQLKGKAQAQWGKLTDDVFDVAEGNTQYLAGKLQEKYGWERERAEKEVENFRKQFEKH